MPFVHMLVKIGFGESLMGSDWAVSHELKQKKAKCNHCHQHVNRNLRNMNTDHSEVATGNLSCHCHMGEQSGEYVLENTKIRSDLGLLIALDHFQQVLNYPGFI